MRNSLSRILLLFTAVALSTVTYADDRWRVSILASEITSTDDTASGLGVAAAYAFRDNWDVEFSASSRNYIGLYTQFVPVLAPDNNHFEIIPVSTYRRYRVNPIDLMVTRHFLRSQRVAPYVRAGVRYVDAPEDLESFPTPVFPDHLQPVSAGYGFSDRTSLQAGAGVLVRLTNNTALRADLTRALRTEEAQFDALTRGALGLSWRF